MISGSMFDCTNHRPTRYIELKLLSLQRVPISIYNNMLFISVFKQIYNLKHAHIGGILYAYKSGRMV